MNLLALKNKKIIDKYFEKVKDELYKMKKSLKNYIDAKQDFYTITGMNYDDIIKSRGKILGFDDLLGNIEDLYKKYIKDKMKYESERQKCIDDINKMSNKIYSLIIEYSYLNEENDKETMFSLQEYHKQDYSYSYFRRLKSEAVKEFEKMIQKDTK